MDEIIQPTQGAPRFADRAQVSLLRPPGNLRGAIRRWAARRGGAVLLASACRRRPGVPRGVAELDSVWLTAALCRSTPGARVLGAKVSPAGEATTTRARVELDYNEPGRAAGLPSTVFVKCTSTLAQRLMIGLGGLAGGEAGFYAHVRPLVEIEAPRGYAAAVDPKSWHSVVLVEDVVAGRGARFWAPGTRLSAGQLRRLLGDLAALHGRLWRSPSLERWRWLRTPAEHAMLIDSLLGFADRTAAGLRRAGASIPQTVRARSPQLREAVRRSLQAATEGPHTYLHGDLHAANLYLTADGRPGICDWQVALKGSWALDFAYLLATAAEVHQRRACERDLLDFYLKRLALAGGGPIQPEHAWEAYRRATIYPYFAWLYTLGRARLQPAFQPREVCVAMLKRIGAAIEDLSSFAALGL